MKGLNLPKKISPAWILGLGLLVLFVPVAIIEADVLRYTKGVFMYPLDDTFIHLEIAQNLVKGNWGINENEFASASSSLLYTVVLTIGRLFSGSTTIPFIINCLAGMLIVWALYSWLKKHGVHPVAQLFIFCLAIFFTPLATMIIMGMEHTIQCLVSFLFIFYFSDWLEENIYNKKRDLPWYIIVFAILAATTRYEGLFLVAIAGVLLLYYRNFKAGFILVSLAILPVVIFGLFSIFKGSYFLPNSVLVKSETATSGLVGFITNVFIEKLNSPRPGLAAQATQRWAVILPLLYLLFRKYLKPSYSFILIFLMTAVILQLALAATGWLYRYEAYLFFCSIIITAILFYKYGRQVLAGYSLGTGIITLIIVFFLFFPVTLRSMVALVKVDRACKNIYDQQYQMASFTNSFYNDHAIAANDIGAVSYFTRGTVVDLWGLASIDVTKSRKNGYWTPVFLDSLCRAKNVSMAMIYDSWFSDALTKRWKKIATWQIQDNVICGDDTVSFYALDSSGNAALYNGLRQFQSRLPASVRVQYY